MLRSVVEKVVHKPTTDAKVIFNASSGDVAASDAQLEEVMTTLKELGLKTDLHVVRPNGHIHHVAARAAKRGTPYVVACGGDNTIDLAARGIIGSNTTLVVVPTGTRNNIAHSLELPKDIPESVRLVTTGKRLEVDVGRVHLVGRQTIFLELLTIGLTAAMFPAMDEAQKGDLGRIGDLLATFITQPAATFRLNLDHGEQIISVQALTIVVLNMPYLGANFQIASSVDYLDGLLDVFVYADLGKLDLLTHAAQIAQGFTDDPRVRHLRVKHIEIETDPPLPIMLDGNVVKEKALRRRVLTLEAAPRMLKVMTQAGRGSRDGGVR